MGITEMATFKVGYEIKQTGFIIIEAGDDESACDKVREMLESHPEQFVTYHEVQVEIDSCDYADEWDGYEE